MSLILWPYKVASQSARALKALFNTKLLRTPSRYYPKRKDKIVNWGNSKQPNWEFNPAVDLNKPEAVARAVNKLICFQTLQGHVPLPDWTSNKNEASHWFNDRGATVVARTVLTGSEGRGIVLCNSMDTLVTAPLYTKYKKKRYELRVHVVKGKVIDVSVKRKRRETNVNTWIRNTAGGWVFCHENVPTIPNSHEIAIKAIETLGLDFGAVDLIYNERENQCYVLEVNTAPGITGTTLNKYFEAFSEHKNG